MIGSKWSYIYVIIIIFTGLSIASTNTDIDKELMGRFEINWGSMQYHKSVSRYNPKVSSNQQPSRTNENLELVCEIVIKDPNFVLGISRQGNFTEMTDSKKQNIEIGQELPQLSRSPSPQMRNIPRPQSFRMRYEGLQYRPQMAQPPKISRWRALLNKIYRIPKKPFKPELINELQPARVRFELDLGLLEKSGGEIRSLKGYFYVLMAESTEHVEVPFEPNDLWVQLTDSLEIQIKEAECTIEGKRIRYNYDIEENRIGEARNFGLSVGDYLPHKIVTERQLIGEDGKPLNRPMGHGPLPAHVGGSGRGSHSGRNGASPIQKIRFVIAVNPKHYKIPFELKNIPLPDPESTEEKER